MTYSPPTGALPDPIHDHGYYENVPVKRLIAFVIDFFIITALALIVVLGFAVVTFGIALMLTLPIAFWTAIAYRVAMLTTKSATLGMMVMGIEFRTANGARFDLFHATIHSLVFSFLFPTIIAPIISAVMMVTTPYGRSIQDMLLGSAAINRPE